MIMMKPFCNPTPVVSKVINEVAKKRELAIGIPKEDTYPNGMKVSDVALMMEFGCGNTLPRPFVRNTMVEKKDEWEATAKDRFKEVIKSGAEKDMKAALEAVGEKIKADVEKSIETLVSPPLKPTTIKAKKRKGRAKPEKPLVDSELLKNSFKVEVKEC